LALNFYAFYVRINQAMMNSNNIPISHTKVVLPRRREEILTRPRLLETLFELLDKKLILVTAPAGYGKTSLLIDLGHQSELPFCWLALDPLDRDPQRFATYFIEAVAERFPGFGNQTKAALDTLTTIENGIEPLVATLINEIYVHIPQHFVLVLDDYHLIYDVPVIQNFLSRFLQLVDENCHLIISSRVLTLLPDLPLMVARDMVGGLDLSELAFRVDEIQALFTQNYNMHISDDTAQQLVNETEGWITGLQLSSLGIVQGMADRLRVARASGVGLFDYLGQQVLDQQPEEIRFFLLRSSLLEEFNTDFCEEVFGDLYPERKKWRQWIDIVIQRNLFALPVGMDNNWVRYHHLFRDFLRDQLQKEHPDSVSPILKNLAKAYEAHNEWEKAYHIRKRLGDVEAIAGLIERAAPYLFSHALLTLDAWLKDLPPSILSTKPGILSIRGAILHMQGSSSEGLELLNKAEAVFRESRVINGLASTLVRRATVYHFLGNYTVALRDADESLRLTESNDQMQSIHALALRQKGLSLFRQGQSRQAIKILERALESYSRLEDTSIIPMLMVEAGMVYAALGKETETIRLNNDALQIWKQKGNLTWQANVLNNIGVLHHIQGNYDKAVLALEEGLLCAQRSGYYIRTEALILISLGDVYAEVEDFALAQQYYQRGHDITQEIGDQFLLNYLILARIRLFIQQNDLKEANYLLNEARGLISIQNSQHEDGLFYFLQGQLLLQEVNNEQAKKALETAEARFEASGHGVDYIKSQLLLASAYNQDNNKEAAIQKLKAVFKDRNQINHPVLVFVQKIRPCLENLQSDPEVGSAIQNLLGKSDQLYKEIPRIRRRIRRLAQITDVPSAKLAIQGFGRAQVKIGERLLTMSDWQTQSVRDLFFYFMTMDQPLTKEQIGLVFWPDIEEPSRLKMRFKNDIYRLRRAVGSNVILYENELYSFNRDSDYEYDVEAFKGFLFQSKLTKEPKMQIELLSKAVSLVNGQFLEDIYASWVIPERERISQEFLSAVLTLADQLKNANEIHEALTLYQKAIDYEYSFETAYMLAIKLYIQLNDRVSAVRLYEAYKEMMTNELDLPPSPEMEAVYKRLVS
jgi:LuxR family transcriptional regulator, maltose regulon positive regulatory protein